MRIEIQRQHKLIEDLTTANTWSKHRLQYEQIAHAQTKQALEIQKKLRRDAAILSDCQRQQLLTCQASHISAQQALELEKKRLEDMAAELDRTQRKLHFVDSLMDTMLLQEDSQLDMSDRSRQVTDLILDLERQMEAKYQALLQEKDNQLSDLYRLLPKSRSSDERECAGRAQSEPVFRYPS